MTQTLVLFVGAGPGAEDLITLRGAAALEAADVVLYAGSLVNPALLRRCRADCQCRDSAGLDLEEQLRLMSEAALAGKAVVRLHTGDPSLYGAIAEQISGLAAHGIGAAIVPGVSSVFAAAAALGCELTLPGLSQSLVLTRSPGRTPMPEGEKAAAFARTGATLAFYLSAGHLDEVSAALTGEGGLSSDCPVALVSRASWEDECILRGTLADIAEQAREAGIGRQALLLVGRVLGEQNSGPEASRLYATAFSHGYRNRLEAERFDGACALYAFSPQGRRLAGRIADALRADGLCAELADSAVKSLPANWQRYEGHIFVGATGIAVRLVAPFLRDKVQDPAVICCTENGSDVLSLVSGHLGGANRLARRVARIVGGRALVSTATDVNELVAFDEAAGREGCRVLNGEAIRDLNAALLAGEPILFRGPEAIYERYYHHVPSVFFEDAPSEPNKPGEQGELGEQREPGEQGESGKPLPLFQVLWDRAPASGGSAASGATSLHISSAAYVLGLGCRRGLAPKLLAETAKAFLHEAGLAMSQVARLASCDVKADEAALLALGEDWGLPLDFHAREALAGIAVPTPSERVREKIGVPSVAEAAALLSARALSGEGARLVRPKAIRGDVTLALARLGHQRRPAEEVSEHFNFENALLARKRQPPQYGVDSALERAACGQVVVVGLGSGTPGQISPEVTEALKACDVAAGYGPYLDFVRHLIVGKPCIDNGMRGEVARCRGALQAALDGRTVCMVCSGDPGILAMAGLLYELREKEATFATVPIAVLPGITAASLAAASLGAPLQNGFSLVSLSDLLVPGEEVRRNLAAVAESALPVVLYNPAGRKRRALLHEALELFMHVRGGETLCALVRNAGRSGNAGNTGNAGIGENSGAEQWIGRLADFPCERVDMSSLVLIGGPRTRYTRGIWGGVPGEILYEARGYADKYW